MFIRIGGFGYGDNFCEEGLNKLCWLCDIDLWVFFLVLLMYWIDSYWCWILLNFVMNLLKNIKKNINFVVFIVVWLKDMF